MDSLNSFEFKFLEDKNNQSISEIVDSKNLKIEHCKINGEMIYNELTFQNKHMNEAQNELQNVVLDDRNKPLVKRFINNLKNQLNLNKLPPKFSKFFYVLEDISSYKISKKMVIKIKRNIYTRYIKYLNIIKKKF